MEGNDVVNNQLIVQLCNIQRTKTNTNPKSISEYVKLGFAPGHQFHSTALEEKDTPPLNVVKYDAQIIIIRSTLHCF